MKGGRTGGREDGTSLLWSDDWATGCDDGTTSLSSEFGDRAEAGWPMQRQVCWELRGVVRCYWGRVPASSLLDDMFTRNKKWAHTTNKTLLDPPLHCCNCSDEITKREAVHCETRLHAYNKNVIDGWWERHPIFTPELLVNHCRWRYCQLQSFGHRK